MYIITLLTSIIIPNCSLSSRALATLSEPLTTKEENTKLKPLIRHHVRVPGRQVLLVLRRLHVHYPDTWSCRELFDRGCPFSSAPPPQEHDLADDQPVRSRSSCVPFWLHRCRQLQHGRLCQRRWSSRSLLLAGFHQHSHWTCVHWDFDCHGYDHTYWGFEKWDCPAEQDVSQNRDLCTFR